MVTQGNALADQQLASMVQVQDGLLLWELGLHKPHARPLYRLADGFCIIAVVFVRSQVRFDKGWRHHSNGMSQPGQFPRPEVCTAAGFHANQTRLQLGKILAHFRSP
jgi:hypothetical protein